MVTNDDKRAPVEIVVAVEATANVVSHWEMIKKQYIVPAVKHFHQQSTVTDDFVSNLSGNRYGLVLFHAADRTPESATECLAPTRNIRNFMKMLDSIQFSGGGGEHFSHITEGLATVLQLFEDMQQTQKNSDTQRYCFLVSNTPPYKLPSVESLQYAGLTWQQLAEKLRDFDVKLSVICPRHIAEMQQIYLANNSQPPMMNYAQDKRHLVLISGFRLPTEKEPIPVTENSPDEKPVSSVGQNGPETPMEVTASVVETTAIATPMSVDNPVSTFSQPNSVPTPSQTTIASAMNVATTNLQTMESQSLISTAQSNVTSATMPSVQATYNITGQPAADVTVTSQVRPIEPQTQTNVSVNAGADAGVGLIRPTMPTQQTPTQVGQIQPTNNLPFSDGQQITDSASVMPKPALPHYAAAQEEAKRVLERAKLSATSSMTQQPTQITEVRVIWSGQLVWTEKRRQPPGSVNTQGTKMTINCSIYQHPPSTPQPEIITSSWPQTINLQFIPQSLINPVQGYLKSHRQLLFQFPHANLAPLLNTFLQKSVCGLVQFSPQPQQVPEVKIVILVYLQKKEDKNNFIGIMPSDSMTFLNALRTVIANMPKRTNTGQGGGMQPTMHQTMATANSNNMMEQQNPGGNMQFRQPRPQFNKVRYQNPMMGMGNQSHINQVNPGMSNMQRVPMSSQQTHLSHIRPTGIAGNSMIRNQMSADGGKLISAIRTHNPGNMQMGVGNITSGSISIPSNQVLMSAGQRVMTGPGGKTGIIRIPQTRTMQMQGSRPQEQTQLRNLLGANTSGMQPGMMNIRQQGNSGLRSTAPGNMQQQNYIRGNMMPGMQNQRQF